MNIIVQSGGDSAAWAAGIGAAVGALSGGFVTWLATRRQVNEMKEESGKQRTHDTDERKLDREHELSLAAADRIYQRRADSYIKFAQYIGWGGRYANWQKQMMIGWVGEPPLRPAHPLESDWEAEALAALYLSDALDPQVFRFNSAIMEMEKAARLAKVAQPGQESVKASQTVIEKCDALGVMTKELLQGLRAELQVLE